MNTNYATYPKHTDDAPGIFFIPLRRNTLPLQGGDIKRQSNMDQSQIGPLVYC